MIPFGAGTSLEGHVAALRGGISIDLTGMTKVLEVNGTDLDCRVEAGLTRLALAQRLAPEGLFFAVDPGADATIGGMAATRASGTTAVRYGTMRENVLGLTVVLADGRIIRTGGRARKSAAGYDLTRLFVGSEGTLGVITEVALRLFGIPEVIASATCAFETIEGAVDSVIETVQLGIPVARIELLDEVQVRACNSYSETNLPEVPTLFIELHGSEAGTKEQAEALAEITGGHGGTGFAWATSTDERNASGARGTTRTTPRCTSCRAPRASSPTCASRSPASPSAWSRRSAISTPRSCRRRSSAMWGTGTSTSRCSSIPTTPSHIAEARRLNGRMVERALALGGTTTGEHGVGHGKIAYIEQEHGEAIEVMRVVKAALDPHSILNPGKIFRERE